MDILDAVMPKYKHMNYEHTDGKMRCLFDQSEQKSSIGTIFKQNSSKSKSDKIHAKLSFKGFFFWCNFRMTGMTHIYNSPY